MRSPRGSERFLFDPIHIHTTYFCILNRHHQYLVTNIGIAFTICMTGIPSVVGIGKLHAPLIIQYMSHQVFML